MIDGAYFAAGSDATQSTKAVLLLTDVFGLPLKNSKILADVFAKEVGCDVWVPDMFNGSPPIAVDALNEYLHDTPGEKQPLLTKLRLVWTIIQHLPAIYKARSSVVDPRIHSFIAKIKEEKKYERLGAVGYCFGGSAGIRLASTDLIDTVVIAHPGRCNITEIKAMKIPTAFACAEEDMSFGPALRNQAEAAFAERKGKDNFIEYEFVDYTGTVHGYAARPNLALPVIKEAFEKTTTQTVQWFKKWL